MPQSAPAELTGFQPDFLEKLPSEVFRHLRALQESEYSEESGRELTKSLAKAVGRPLTREEVALAEDLGWKYYDSLTGLADLGASPGESPAYILDLHRGAGSARYAPSASDLHHELAGGLTERMNFGDENAETLNRVLDAAASAWSGEKKPKLGAYEDLYETLQDEIDDLYGDSFSKDQIKDWVSELRSVYGPRLNYLIKEYMTNDPSPQAMKEVEETKGDAEALLEDLTDILKQVKNQ